MVTFICHRVGLRRAGRIGPQMTFGRTCIYVPCKGTLARVQTQEAYVVAALLSYTRRYWRRCLSRKTHTTLGLQLLRVLKANPKRSRDSCRKTSTRAMGAVKTDHIEARACMSTYSHVYSHVDISYVYTCMYTCLQALRDKDEKASDQKAAGALALTIKNRALLSRTLFPGRETCQSLCG